MQQAAIRVHFLLCGRRVIFGRKDDDMKLHAYDDNYVDCTVKLDIMLSSQCILKSLIALV